MGRSISQAASSSAALASNALPLLPGQLPLFGNGKFLPFYATTTFIITAPSMRFRVTGGGATGLVNGGTASVGALLSATGGACATGLAGGLGGTGTGGDYQASGGSGGATPAPGARGSGGGGGGAGSELGNGGQGGAGYSGAGACYGGGGGGVGLANGGPGAAGVGTAFGGSIFGAGRDLFGLLNNVNDNQVHGAGQNPAGAIVPFPTFAFMGGAAQTGLVAPQSGPGAGGSGYGATAGNYNAGAGGVCGGGAGFPDSGGVTDYAATPGGVVLPSLFLPDYQVSSGQALDWPQSGRQIGGGYGALITGGVRYGGNGGGGYARGVFNGLVVGATLTITVGAGAFVIAEW